MLELFSKAAKHESKAIPYKLWADGNEPKELYSNHFIDQKLDYIHNNPVKQLIVDKPEEYKFSSATNYAGLGGLLKVEFV